MKLKKQIQEKLIPCRKPLLVSQNVITNPQEKDNKCALTDT